MAYPDRKKLAEVLEGGGPVGADPTAAGQLAPPEAGPPPGTPGPAAAVPPQGAEGAPMPGMPEVTAVPPEAADMAASLGLEGGGGMEVPPEMTPEEGTVMPGNLSPQEQEQIQQALAMAARRRMVGGF